MENKTLKKAREVKKEFKKLTLQIYEGDRPLTQAEQTEVLNSLTWEHAELLSKEQPEEIKGICIAEEYAYNGPGVCIAKKFLKWGRSKPECSKCKSDEIINQLNYIFKKAFDNKYRAAWRKKRTYNKKPK